MSVPTESIPLERLAEVAGFGLFQVDADRTLVAVSPELEAITGFSRDEVLGKSCLTMVRCPQCLKGCGVFERGQVRNIPLTLFRKDGSEVRVLKSGTVLRDESGEITGAVETVRPFDDADLGAGTGAIDAGQILEGLGRMYLATDADRQIVSVSNAFARMVGRSAEELRGTALASLFGEDLFGVEGTLTRALEAGERREGWRARMTTAEGSRIDVSLSAGPAPGAACGGAGDARFVLMLRAESTQGELAIGGHYHGMIGRSRPMQEIFRLIELLRGNDAAVLIGGESGTGKELVARAVHASSHRADRPFVAVNCAAIPNELIESELFGHVRGAFTGALRDRAGRFEAADGGTLFLDEIGDLPLQLQGKLLRVIQENAFERVGENRTRRVDVRVIAATHRDLAHEATVGSFRQDLYYRLRVIPIHVPALRDRREDIPLLIDHFLARIGTRHHRALRLSPGANRALLSHDWPGNVRELENVIEYATTVCEGQTIHVDELPPEVIGHAPAAHRTVGAESPLSPPDGSRAPASPVRLPGSGGTVVGAATASARAADDLAHLAPCERREAEGILDALRQARFHRGRAAERLGISRTTLWRKMRELGL